MAESKKNESEAKTATPEAKPAEAKKIEAAKEPETKAETTAAKTSPAREDVVEVASERLPEPGDKTGVIEKLRIDKTTVERPLNVNVDTILFLLYLEYKSNMLTRLQLKNALKLINGEHPESIAQWLLTEAAK